MKAFGYILACYLLLLAAIPCCTIDDCPDDKGLQTEQHDSGDEDCGTCSPFFNCEGCATATEFYSANQFDFHTAAIPAVYTFYLQPSLPETAIDFWQPPKLS